MIAELKKQIHTIIDASAGTGKTYTICEIVIDRIKAGYNIEEFIIMTFTEKAAGELISRIRKGIKDELSKSALSNDEKTNLQRALKNFDYATISTIHGFCQKILKEYAFECNIPYNQDVNNNNDFIKYAYGDVTFKTLIDKLEQLSDEDVKKLFSKDGDRYCFETILSDIAKNININIDELLPNKNNFEYKNNDLIDKFYSVNFNDLKAYLEKQRNNDGSIKKASQNLINKIKGLYSSYGKSDFFDKLKESKFSDGEIKNLTIFYQNKFGSLARDIVLSNNNAYNNYLLGFKAQIINDVTERYEEIKKNNLTITFNDMIILVANSLKDINSPLKSIMQKKYKIGIIDEFQDTTPAQWNIAEEIFLKRVSEQTSLPHHLIIVGDEKQSIYSFQGANVETYREAKRIMKNDYSAQTVNLEYNYRTSKELLNCFNNIFSQKDLLGNDFWFPYNEVKYPIANGYKRDINDGISLGIYHIDTDKEKIQENYSKFIATEIINNINKGYKYSDICVLVRKKTEAEYLVNIFNEKKIPYTYYKEAGLYNSLEGNELFFLLSALAFPYKKQYKMNLILTRFFHEYGLKSLNIDENKLSEIEKKLDIWREYFDKYGFYYMMEKIFIEQNLFSNILNMNLFPEDALVETESPERSITNFKHIVKKLSDNGSQNNSILDYYNSFNDFRNSSIEEDLQEIDTDKSKVQIMTMHASKGLEFKIVFIFGPFCKVRELNFIALKDKKIYKIDNNIDLSNYSCDTLNKMINRAKLEQENELKEKIAQKEDEIKDKENELNNMNQLIGQDNVEIIDNYNKSADTKEKIEKIEANWLVAQKSKPETKIYKNAKAKYDIIKNYDEKINDDHLAKYNDLIELRNIINKLKSDLEKIKDSVITRDMIVGQLLNNLDLEETKRLLYVAFTRAKDKLYLPYIISDSDTYAKLIINSGVSDVSEKYKYDLIDNGTIETETDKSESVPNFIKQDTDIDDVSKNQRFVNSFSNRYGIDFVKLGIISKEEYEELGIKDNVYIEDVNVSNEDAGTLHKSHGDNSDVANEPVSENDNEIIMPGGTKIGNMLHEIFEKIDFFMIMSKGVYGTWKQSQEAESNENNPIEKITEDYRLANKYKENVYKMVWNTLHTPLPNLNGFAIGDIKNFFKEISFNLKIEDNDKDKYLAGTIDMVFEDNDGNIYIIDWKSNKTPNGNYSNEDVENIMKEHAYKLQYALYKYAVNEWLKQNGINKEVAGGFYVFLRPAEKGENAKVVELK